MERIATDVKSKKSADNDNAISFIVNDNVAYTSVGQFKSPSNANEFRRLQTIVKKLGSDVNRLRILREKYASAAKTVQRKISEEITTLEQEIIKGEREKRILEKSIRNTENLLIK